MSASRFNSEAPAAKEPKRRKPQAKAQGRQQNQGQDQPEREIEGEAQAQARPQQETPLWEKLAGLVGLLLVLGVLGFLLYEAARPQTEAEIVTAVQSITPQAGGYLVIFTASNQGRQTAAAVLVEGALYDPASPEEPVETAEVTFDYIPDRSDRTGSFVFENDPRAYELRIQVKGFMEP
jgi:uncharacterized protein (TIGR02588 family)